MNRVEIKNKAKEMIKGNKWFIWKPLVIFYACIIAITVLAFGLDYAFGFTKYELIQLADGTSYMGFTGGLISYVVEIFTYLVSCAFAVGYTMYILSFVRGNKLTFNDIIDFMKKHWVVSVIVSVIVGLIITGGTILLVIPGIIAAIGLMFYQEVCADNLEMRYMEIVKKAWSITKGHKVDLFVMGLSFLGWAILASFTLGILYIWLTPYILVSFTLAYEELKKAA